VDVYIDVLFLENLIINYILLFITKKISKINSSNLRMFMGAIVGALYVIVLVVSPDTKIYYTITAKLALSLVIIAIAFTPEKFKNFMKTLGIFYLTTFMFAGAAFAFMYINQSGSFVRNGVVYVFWQSKWTMLFLSIAVALIIARIIMDLVQSRFVKEKLLIPLKIVFEKKFTDISALVDTGNSLHDPLTNLPVVVVEFDAIKHISPDEIKNIFEENKENDFDLVTDVVSCSNWFNRFRLIPFTSLGKENGMLIGFKPDYIEIGEDIQKKGIRDVIVGIYGKNLSKNENYKALLGPELV